MNSWAEAKKNSLKQARVWARAGNVMMAQHFLNQACSCGYVSNRQVMALNKMLEQAREAKNGAKLQG